MFDASHALLWQRRRFQKWLWKALIQKLLWFLLELILVPWFTIYPFIPFNLFQCYHVASWSNAWHDFLARSRYDLDRSKNRTFKNCKIFLDNRHVEAERWIEVRTFLFNNLITPSIFFINAIFSLKFGDQFPRVCRGCGNEDPLRRAVSFACGHVVCSECADGANTCPHSECRTKNALEYTKFVRIYENDQHTRECGICDNKSPVKRIALTSCGHIICQICNLLMLHYSSRRKGVINCPFCRAETTYRKMHEDIIWNNDEIQMHTKFEASS